jgi:hypothetical protein
METDGGVEVQLHLFLTSALDGGEWLASPSGRFTPEERTRQPMARRLGGPRAGLNVMKRKTLLCRESNPDRLACSLVTVLTEQPRFLLYKKKGTKN